MKTDLYTKTILTIIAICLTINVVKDADLIPSAYAAEPELKIDSSLTPNATETIDVRIVDINTYDELNVNVRSIDTYDEMKVNINSINTSDELDVNVDEIGGSWVSAGGSIPVKIQQ